MGFHRLLIALDGQPLSAHAANVGMELARALGAQLAFVYVLEEPSNLGAGDGLSPNEALEIAKDDAKKFVTTIRQQEPQLAILEFMPTGRASEEIVKAAKEWPADIIVIGSHGRGGLQRFTLGSVAEAVMRHASCPVMIVKAEE